MKDRIDWVGMFFLSHYYILKSLIKRILLTLVNLAHAFNEGFFTNMNKLEVIIKLTISLFF